MAAEQATAKAEPSSIKLAFTLGFAGLLSGLALVAVYEATLPTIEANKAEALRVAVFKVVKNSSAMQKLVVSGGKLAIAAEGDKQPGIFAAYGKDGRFVGYAIPGKGNGFQDTISLLYGFDPAKKKVVGMEILESRETPGLGDKIFKDKAFVGNFSALDVDPQIVVVKSGRKKPNEVDAITGATISSKAVVKIINEANKSWRQKLAAPGSEPALKAQPKKGAAAQGKGH